MTKPGIYSLMILSLLVGVDSVAQTGAPTFDEVYQLLKTRAVGLSETELNRAAVEGLVSELSPRVQLVLDETAKPAVPTVSKSSVFDEKIGYIRVAKVTADFPEDLRRAWQQISFTNKLSGLVLDLRYANGIDYPAAAAASDMFSTKAQPVLKWGEDVTSSKDKTNAVQVPLAVLVNGATSGSAEALAAALRYSGAGLVLGSKTAGQALVMEEFSLKGGAKVRIATTPVSLGDGTLIGTNGVRPDIEVLVNADQERSYYADAFHLVPKTNLAAAATGTNGTRRTRFGEAELVREHRSGLLHREDSEEPRVREPEPEKPLVSDPVLARALDLLKGLAVVRQFRS